MMLKHIDRHGKEIIIQFGNKSIEFNQYSLVHIYFKHYGKIIKQTELEKSFHKNDIDYLNIGIQLKDILERINSLNIKQDTKQDIIFKYKKRLYCVWISTEKIKSIKGISGMIRYFRINTFYPIENKQILKKCEKLDEIRIDDELSLMK
jgi:hypothetical protein